MNEFTVYDFQSYREFLSVAAGRYGARRSRKLTLDQWAEKLGYRSPRSIAMVLKGQRAPSEEMVSRISRYFKLTKEETDYLWLLVRYERNLKKQKDPKEILEQLEKLNPKLPNEIAIDAVSFAYVAEWYHLVIKQLVDTPSFRENTSWIKERLRGKVTSAEVENAISKMLKLGILQRDSETGRLRTTGTQLKTASDIPSDAIKHHHEGMLQRAAEAQREQSVNNREITSVTLRINKARIGEAKKAIREFRERFHKEFSSSDTESVWQLGIQLFEHTETAPLRRKAP